MSCCDRPSALFVMLMVLSVSGIVQAQIGRPEVDVDVQPLTDKELDELLNSYKGYDLPLPPASASLVGLDALAADDNSNWRFGFQWTAQGVTYLMRGATKATTAEWAARNDGSYQFYDGADAYDKIVGRGLWGDVLFFGIQAHAQGHHDVARDVIQRLLRKPIPLSRGPGLVRNRHLSAPDALELAAWRHYEDLIEGDALSWDRSAAPMRRLVDGNELVGREYNRRLVESLELANRGRESKPGSIECLIDELAGVRRHTGEFDFAEPSPEYLRILLHGLDAAPVLIRHLDDKRLTMSLRSYLRGPSRLQTVSDLAEDLLDAISGGAVRARYDKATNEYRIDPVVASDWLKDAQQVGEGPYLATRIFEVERNTTSPNEDAMRIIAHKYPELLFDVYLTGVREHPEFSSHTIAQLIASAEIPTDRKVDAFERACQTESTDHTLVAMRSLCKVDKARGAARLMQQMKRHDVTASPAGWTNPEPQFLNFAVEIDDPDVWQSLGELVTRLPSAARIRFMEVIPNVACKWSEKQRFETARLLLPLLRDRSAHETEEEPSVMDLMRSGADSETIHKAMMNSSRRMGRGGMFDGAEGGVVRVIAASRLRLLLELSESPRADGSDDEWTEFEQRVRTELDGKAPDDSKPDR